MEILAETPTPATTLKVETFADLLQIVNTHPVWRQQLVRALFPEVDVAKAFQALAKTQEQLMVLLMQLSAGQEELKTRVTHLETDVAVLKTDVAVLKGDVFEGKYRDKAAAILGKFIRRGKDMTHDVADLLYEARLNGQISENEYDQVLAVDLLWGGQLRSGKGEVVLVVETSWRAMAHDVERAVTRASVLRRIGLTALPVVAGNEWGEDVLESARKQEVVVAIRGIVTNDSWQQIFSAEP